MDSEKKSGREFEMKRSKILMRRLIMSLRARMDDELRVKKITTAQLGFLNEVNKNPGGSSAQMARACYVTPQSAQSMMVRAVKHGWVVRGKDAENDRLVTVSLTPAGERLLEYAHALYGRLEAEVWAGVPLADLRVMNQVLTRGLENLEN